MKVCSTLLNVACERIMVELMNVNLRSRNTYVDIKFIVRVSWGIKCICRLVEVAENQLECLNCLCMIPKSVVNSNIRYRADSCERIEI
jgi:hypothetical protein